MKGVSMSTSKRKGDFEIAPSDNRQGSEPTAMTAPFGLQRQPSKVTLFRVPLGKTASEMQVAARTDQSLDSILISRGSGNPAFGKLAGSSFDVPPSRATRFTFLPTGSDSQITYHPSAQTFVLSFDKGFLKSLLAEAIPSGEFYPRLFRVDTQSIRLARMMEAEICTPGFASAMHVEGISRAIAVSMLRLDNQLFPAETGRICIPAWKLKRVMEFIEANLAQDIRLSDLAALANLSTFHFAHVFKQATGTSPYQFVRDRRLERSRALLIENKLDLTQLALCCGFSSQSHFTAAFTKAVGIPPGRFRRQQRR